MVIDASARHRRLVLVVAAIVAAATATASAAVLPGGCQTAIEVSSVADLRWSSDDVRQFRREVEQAWTPLGVDVCWRDARTPCDHAGVTLHVRIAQDVPRAEGTPTSSVDVRRALGWIGFSDADGPGTFIVLSIRRAIELLGRAELAARRLQELPGMVERLLPRAMGRALAHELGHYLLARRSHSSRGLMRAAFRPEDVADVDRGRRMRVAPPDARAIALRCVPQVAVGARYR